MVKVSIEVRAGAARFDVAVSARSSRRALSLVGGSNPHSGLMAKPPVYSEGSFEGGPAFPAMMASQAQPSGQIAA